MANEWVVKIQAEAEHRQKCSVSTAVSGTCSCGMLSLATLGQVFDTGSFAVPKVLVTICRNVCALPAVELALTPGEPRDE